MGWSVHFLQAEGDLSAWGAQLERAADQAMTALAASVALPSLDIVFEHNARGAIPELGHGGYALRQSALFIPLDPASPRFAAHLGVDLHRTLAHEVAHCLRWASVGYGRRLGEALVSEGLADQLAREVFGGDGQIWNHALDEADVPRLLACAVEEHGRDGYDHQAWFFGGPGIPRWAGYGLGYRIVGAYLDRHPEARASRLLAAPADTIFDAVPDLLDSRTGDGRC